MLNCAHTEARSVENGIALVKLMGRHAGFIAAGATVASQDVNFTLIPEVRFRLEGERGFLAALERRIGERSHAVIVVAEGAGQDLLECRATRNVMRPVISYIKDIGLFLRQQIENIKLKSQNIPVLLRYFDPSYEIRSCTADSEDAIFLRPPCTARRPCRNGR